MQVHYFFVLVVLLSVSFHIDWSSCVEDSHSEPDIFFFPHEVGELFLLPPFFLACNFVALLMIKMSLSFHMLLFRNSVGWTTIEIKESRRVRIFLAWRSAVFNFRYVLQMHPIQFSSLIIFHKSNRNFNHDLQPINNISFKNYQIIISSLPTFSIRC